MFVHPCLACVILHPFSLVIAPCEYCPWMLELRPLECTLQLCRSVSGRALLCLPDARAVCFVTGGCIRCSPLHGALTSARAILQMVSRPCSPSDRCSVHLLACSVLARHAALGRACFQVERLGFRRFSCRWCMPDLRSDFASTSVSGVSAFVLICSCFFSLLSAPVCCFCLLDLYGLLVALWCGL